MVYGGRLQKKRKKYPHFAYRTCTCSLPGNPLLSSFNFYTRADKKPVIQSVSRKIKERTTHIEKINLII